MAASMAYDIVNEGLPRNIDPSIDPSIQADSYSSGYWAKFLLTQGLRVCPGAAGCGDGEALCARAAAAPPASSVVNADPPAKTAHTTPYSRSPASPSPGTMKPRSLR
jgi:hypothetical protein